MRGRRCFGPNGYSENPHVHAAAATVGDSFTLEYLNDSGAGRNICSVRALHEQGLPKAVISKFAGLSSSPIQFETGGERSKARNLLE